MPDREKVVRAVETCFDSWIDKHRNMGLDFHKVEQMKRDALELLKEQEAVKSMAGGLCGVGGWISVKDRLPKKFGEPCIVYNGCSVQYGDYYSDGIWYTPDCYESEEIRDVTHWMPMPEPPKEEEHD